MSHKLNLVPYFVIVLFNDNQVHYPTMGLEMVGSMCWIDVDTDISGHNAKYENWHMLKRRSKVIKFNTGAGDPNVPDGSYTMSVEGEENRVVTQARLELLGGCFFDLFELSVICVV